MALAAKNLVNFLKNSNIVRHSNQVSDFSHPTSDFWYLTSKIQSE